MPTPVTRENLKQKTLEVLQTGSTGNPDVLLVDWAGERAVVKDFRPRSWFVRVFLGYWITAREVRANRALEGVPAVPRLRGRIDGLAFAVDYRPGRRMSRLLKGRIPARFVDDLAAAIAEMHARGVFHLDLSHRTNVMIGEDDRPVLIDFASAICVRPNGWRARLLRPLLAWADLRALEKWRVRLVGNPPD